MKRIFVKASSDGFVDPKARVAARTLLKSYNELIAYMDRNEDILENLLNDSSFYDKLVDEARWLNSIVNPS